MRTGFIFTVILSFALLPPNGFVSRVSADDELFDDPSAGELFDAAPDQDESSDEDFFAADSVEDDDELLFDASPLRDNPPLDEDPPVDRNYPDTQRPNFGEIQAQIEQSPGKSKVQKLKTKIREEEDETKRQALADELTKELQKLFDEDFQKRDDELEKLEARVSKLRTSLDKRKAARDRIIKNRIESIMLQADGLGLPGENGYSPAEFDFGQSVFNGPDSPGSNVKNIKVVETYPDGSKKVQVHYTAQVPMQRTRTVPYTVMTTQQRTRTVNNRQQTYTVSVPKKEMRTETYVVSVPEQRNHELIIEKGQSVQRAVNDWVLRQADLGVSTSYPVENATPARSEWRDVPAQNQATSTPWQQAAEPPTSERPIFAPRDARPNLSTDEQATPRRETRGD